MVSRLNYESTNKSIDILALAITQVWGGEQVGPMERSEATDIVSWLNDNGYEIVPAQNTAADTGIARALGME